jgi:hypothetical protein
MADEQKDLGHPQGARQEPCDERRREKQVERGGGVARHPRPSAAYTVAAAMVLFVLTGQVPAIMLVALLILVYLTGLELWREEDLPFLYKAWWCLLVFLLHLVGFGMFWIWLTVRRRRRREA